MKALAVVWWQEWPEADFLSAKITQLLSKFTSFVNLPLITTHNFDALELAPNGFAWRALTR